MQLEPYIYFHGTCEDALNFYAKCFGGKIEGLTRMSEAPKEFQGDPSWSNKVMHASFIAGDMRFMCSDGRPGTPPHGEDDLALSVATPDVAEGERVFKALSEGGTVETPFAKAFWGGMFGQVTDKFGIQWMVTAGA
ncbi:MAG TPA: VOC family protein [Candidatus Acidoferrum sp.]|nr:VOC family protein [Candidatus Acidoferrum sp.]